MSQKNMLKSDILKILSKDISGGRRGQTTPIIPGIISDKDPNCRPTFENAQTPSTFFGGKNQPYYAMAQEPHPAASAMSPIVPGIIRDKDPSKRKTYKSAEQPNVNGGANDPKCKKAQQEVVKFCAKPKSLRKKADGKTKRPPSAYNLFVKKYFAENKSATMKSAAAAWKASKSDKPLTLAPVAPKAPIKVTSFQPPPPPKKRKLKIVAATKPDPVKKRKLKIVEPKKPAAANNNYASAIKRWANADMRPAEFDESTTLVKKILNGDGDRVGATSSRLIDDMIRLHIFTTLEFDNASYKTFDEMEELGYTRWRIPEL